MGTWQYMARRATGEGYTELLDPELPLSAPEITTRLSGHSSLAGKLDRFYERVVSDDDRALLDPWTTEIWAVDPNGRVAGGGFYQEPASSGPTLTIDCVGYTFYIDDMPFDDSWYGVQVDPLDVVRKIWGHAQSQPGGNIGLRIADTTTPIRIGTELENVQFQTAAGEMVAFEAGPVKLNWWTTGSMASKVDELAKETPFDYRERHALDGDGMTHDLDLGYPRLGSRREDLRFVWGENISRQPSITRPGASWANEVFVTGAGEGRDMIRSPRLSSRKPGQLRRVARVSDPDIESVRAATERAKYELSIRNAEPSITELYLRNHDNAPIGSWQEGDEIPVIVGDDWFQIDSWLRVVETTIYPDQPDLAKIGVVRTDRGIL